MQATTPSKPTKHFFLHKNIHQSPPSPTNQPKHTQKTQKIGKPHQTKAKHPTNRAKHTLKKGRIPLRGCSATHNTPKNKPKQPYTHQKNASTMSVGHPTKKQEKVMEKHCIQDRVIYNLCVARSSPDIMKKWYPSMPFLQYVEEYTFPVYNDVGKKIGKETRGGWVPRAWIKTDINGKTMSNWDYVKELRDDNEWFKDGSSAVQDYACRIVEQAFKNWWGNPQHFSAPKLRSKYAAQGFGWNFGIMGVGIQRDIVSGVKLG